MQPHPTYDKLCQLKLFGMADGFEDLETSPDSSSLSHAEYLGILLDFEETYRDNKKIQSRLKAAKLRAQMAFPEDIDYKSRRGLDKGVCKALLSCQWIDSKQNLIVTGPCGIGKTWLSCAFGVAACRRGYPTLYKRLPQLLDELDQAHLEGEFRRTFRTLTKPKLLIIDEWGPDKMTPGQRRDFRELVGERFEASSTLIISQLPIKYWDQVIGDPTYTDSILDRIIPNAHQLNLQGESLRKFLPK